jgi:hypothetical protein
MGKTRRQLLEEASVYVEEFGKEMISLDQALSIMEAEEDTDFDNHLANLKNQMQELDKLFDNLNKEIND